MHFEHPEHPGSDETSPDHPAGRPLAAASAGPDAGPDDWERPSPRVPVLRWRGGVTAVLVLLVAAAAWWCVSWLSTPAPPPVGAGGAGLSAGAGGTPARGSADPTSPGPTSPGPTTPGATSPGPGSERAGSGGPTQAGPPAGTPTGPGGEPEGEIRVHVVGEVRQPGVVALRAGARVTDAVRAAGGSTRQARTERINLAAPLADGDQVLVPSASTPPQALAAAAGAPRGVQSEDGAAAEGAGARRAHPSGQAPTSGSPGGAVDLNRADAAELETLPGVGPATAEKIIAHREGVGPFTGLQDLDAVPGIGPAALERLRGLVSW